MFSIYEFKDKTIYEKKFSSLSELNLFLLSNPEVNTSIFGPAERINSVYYEKCGLPYDDCVKYLLSGYKQDIDLLFDMTSHIDSHIESSSERIYKKSVVGSRPNVVNYITGSPLTMYKRQKYEDLKVIDIYFNIQSPWNTTKEAFLNRGILTYTLVKLLESNNYKVNLVVFCSSVCKGEDEMFYYQIEIKNLDENLVLTDSNIFALCAPEMFRRIIFRIVESTPFKNPSWNSDYGSEVPKDLLESYLNINDNSILILNPKEMNIKGNNLLEDTEHFLKKLNLSDKINIDQNELNLRLKKMFDK